MFPAFESGSIGLSFLYVSIGFRLISLAYTRDAMFPKTGPAIAPPDAYGPSFFIATMQLYFGSLAGKYPQKLHIVVNSVVPDVAFSVRVGNLRRSRLSCHEEVARLSLLARAHVAHGLQDNLNLLQRRL